MKSWHKRILIICCLLGMVLSAFYHMRRDPFLLGEKVAAPVHINIEIDKDYQHSVAIVARLNDGNNLFNLTGETSDSIDQVMLYTDIIKYSQDIPYITALYLQIPKETPLETIDAIEGISIFIGNKLFYFSTSDIAGISDIRENEQYLLYKLPSLVYEKSKIVSLLKLPSFMNWYGDFNFVINTFLTIITRPYKFIIAWFFFIVLIILCRQEFQNIYSFVMINSKKYVPELILLCFIVLIGFALRFNGYTRSSLDFDQLYSVSLVADPAKPFMSTFSDPGNPPFFNILLRLWFSVFGWTEQSGRLLPVLIGTAAIVSLYFLVKQFAGKKAAFFAATYMALSAYFIGWSQTMRGYILTALLVSIAASRFLIILKNQKLNLKDILLYILPSILLVNIHYYASLFIFVNFLYFIFYHKISKSFTLKNAALFFVCNIIIALSLLPYFIYTALQRTLLDTTFNTWISKPGAMFISLAALIPFLIILYIHLRKTLFNKILTNTNSFFIDYSVFVSSIIYLIVFAISMTVRSILVPKHLMIIYPLLITSVSIILIKLISDSSRIVSFISICFAFIWVVGGYEAEQFEGRSDYSSVYYESLAYVSLDAQAHPEKISVVLPHFYTNTSVQNFYNYKDLPVYNNDSDYDVLYCYGPNVRPIEMYAAAEKLGIDKDRILRIRVNKKDCVLKIYAKNQTN